MRSDRFLATVLLVSLLLGAAAATGQEAEEVELGWYDAAELSLVVTAGNSETETVGFKNTLGRRWAGAELKLEAGGLRAESTSRTRTAVGTSRTDFRLVEESRSELTAEQYHLRGRYDRKLSDRLFWFAGAGWNRNEFAGISSRYTAFGGVGNRWFEDPRARFRTDYGFTYTRQEDVVEDPSEEESFFGLRFSWEYWRKLTSTTTYTSELIVDENLDRTSDLRADFLNSVSVAMSQRLALKLSLQLLFDNEPALERVPLFDPQGESLGEVEAELDDLDSVLTVALVVDF